ncbi:site-specific integrase [Pedobacter sp. Du54]|uniref:site-specific integrase n=1 Tax=Pedobacter anseongensis TaxID=3133439 RepID=UPI00309F41B1
MIETIGTVRFNLRIDKTLKDGKAPVELIYSISQQRKYYNTGIKLYPEYWDVKNQSAFYIPLREAKKLFPQLNPINLFTELEITEINKSLLSVVNSIDTIEKSYQINKTAFTSEMVINTLKGANGGVTKKAEQSNYLFDFMDQYINDHEATREAGSLTVYKSVKNHLKAYQEATRHKVTFETIDYSFFNKLQTFLINRVKTDKAGNESPMLNNTTIAKALSTLKTFLSYARRQGIKVNESYRDFTIKKEKLEVIALEQSELNSILDLNLEGNNRLDKARDIFVFSCATGLRYSDVAQLKWEHIKNNIITLTVKKTKTELTIPLNSISAAILSKYKNQHKPLPTISNQNLNYNIKDLCKLAGITSPIEIVRFNGKKRNVVVYPKYELIHFHTGRKTFVTLSLEKGMSAEEVMEISGHSDYRSFKRYVKVTEKRKTVVMRKAWGEVSNLKVV